MVWAQELEQAQVLALVLVQEPEQVPALVLEPGRAQAPEQARVLA
jgi:hypothetical protein